MLPKIFDWLVKSGNFIARKRLPDDVREEYGRRDRAYYEAKFSRPASIGPHVAKQEFREWDAEVTARIEAIRAERKGEGISLSRRQARIPCSWTHGLPRAFGSVIGLRTT
jgi:hypothetical protein